MKKDISEKWMLDFGFYKIKEIFEKEKVNLMAIIISIHWETSDQLCFAFKGCALTNSEKQ